MSRSDAADLVARAALVTSAVLMGRLIAKRMSKTSPKIEDTDANREAIRRNFEEFHANVAAEMKLAADLKARTTN